MQSPMLAVMRNGLRGPNVAELKLTCQPTISAESAIGTSQGLRPVRAVRTAAGAAALIVGLGDPRACRPSLVTRSAAGGSRDRARRRAAMLPRSEEHTSELQSR